MNDLKKLFRSLWLLHILDFHIVMNRLIYSDKLLLKNDKKFLTFYYGEKKASKMLAYLHDYKKKYGKELAEENNDSEYLIDMEEQRKELTSTIELQYKRMSPKNENNFVISLIKDICLPIDGVT